MEIKKTFPKLAARRSLGTNLRVSPVCIGIVQDPRTVPEAFDAGVNFFFLTADMHWPLYEPLRRGLAMLLERGSSLRDEIVVALVSYVTQPEFCVAPFKEAIASVPNLRRADLTVIGGSYAADFFVRHGRYKTHRTGAIPGGVSALGASFHDRPAAANALSHGLVDIAYCRYNAAHRGAEVDIFPHVRGKDRKTLLYTFTSASGYVSPARCHELGLPKKKWRPTVTDHHRFALTPKAVDGILCAPKTPAELRGIEDAIGRGPLAREELEYMHDLANLDLGRASL
jgi:hypothetical protein